MNHGSRSDGTPSKVTLKFFAEHLGLSKTTISIVLNNASRASSISVQTRERILQAAKHFNYRPNFLGRSLNDGRSYLIGVVSPDLSEGYTSGILAGIENFLIESEYHFFIASHCWSETRAQKTFQLFAERSVDGVIMVNTPYVPELTLPTVHIGVHKAEMPGPSLIVDNHSGILQAMTYLVSRGHRRIAFIRGHEGSADSEDRWNAVLAAAQQLSIEIDYALVVQLERLGVLSLSAIEEGARCAERLEPMRGLFTALMSFNDMSAIGAMNRLRLAGWNIPEEVSVVGFDDVPESRITYPTLTTVRQPLHAMGEAAARELISSIKVGVCRKTTVFKTELIVRESTSDATSA